MTYCNDIAAIPNVDDFSELNMTQVSPGEEPPNSTCSQVSPGEEPPNSTCLQIPREYLTNEEVSEKIVSTHSWGTAFGCSGNDMEHMCRNFLQNSELESSMACAPVWIAAKDFMKSQSDNTCLDEKASVVHDRSLNQEAVISIYEIAPAPIERETSELQGQTTVTLMNLPNNAKRAYLLRLLDRAGFRGRYDFVYLPMDFRKDANLGYAYVNFVSPEDAALCKEFFDGFQGWRGFASRKICQVCPADYQGLQCNVEWYRNRPVMHESVNEEHKPIIFDNGTPIPFPPSTRPLSKPTYRFRQ
jgi:RNA recognition motif-containing protein